MDQIMSILTIQSRVTSGYVGNAAAVPILQRLGHTVWPIDTVNFSNHPAHGSHTGQIRSASEIDALVDGLQQQHLLSRCDAVLSGYLGSAAAGPAVRAAVQRARDANPTAKLAEGIRRFAANTAKLEGFLSQSCTSCPSLFRS